MAAKTSEKTHEYCRDASDAGIAARMREKYRTMRAMRLASEVDERVVQSQMRALAKEFPGALREIDVLPMEVIEARIVELDAAFDDGALPEWARWIDGYHAWLRVALSAKASAKGDQRSAFVASAMRENFSHAQIRATSLPAARERLSEWAMQVVASELDVSVEAVRGVVLCKCA